ncbi:MAG TPA: tetratricopeptide repeat protein [Bacteroidia bacterium]|jgi:serine phosphatase RsbU (regulator of sigma subunit)/tetratricopeptide (TPR) repeat protein|nr:tetratricopeptide repeat protein [Bacteroidia bacterium]
MKKTRQFFFLIVLICFCGAANAQDYINAGLHRLDSLKRFIHKNGSDTSAINPLNELAQEYLNLNQLVAGDSAAREALRQADQLHYTKYKGDSYNKIGLILLVRNQPDSARAYFIRALEEDKREKNKANYIKRLGNIGISYSAQGKFDQALSCHQSALRLAELFKEHRVMAFCYNNLGSIYLSKSQYQLALASFSKSLSFNTDQHDRNSKYISLKFISGIYQTLGNYAISLQYLNQALDLAKVIGNKYKVQFCLGSMANIYNNLGNRTTALDYYFQALKIAEEAQNNKDISDLLGDIGHCYYDLGDKEKGIAYLKKAYTKVLESGNKIGIAYATCNNAIIYTEEGNFDEAITEYKKAIVLMKESGIEDVSHTAYYSIGDIYKRKAKQTRNADSCHYYYALALEYYTQALRLADSYGKRNELVNGFYRIGQLNEEQGFIKKAEEYYEKCIKQSILTGEISVRQNAYNRLSEIYGNQKKFQQQINYYKNYIVLRDSLTNLAGAEKKVRSELNFQYEQRQTIEKEKQKQQNNLILAEKKRQKTLLWAVISIALFILLIATIMYRNFLEKKRINRELENKNQKIRNANKIIKEKNHEITDSINYALHIQQAILPDRKQIQELLPQSFILFHPKDIVSGDFYFFTRQHEKLFIAAADCTGHGVPGGFMSMIGTEKLTSAVQQTTDPGKILSLLNEGIKSSLHQTEHDYTNRDGMDIALCSIDLKTLIIEFAGANRPMWIVRKSSDALEEIAGTKSSIGGITEIDKQFYTHTIQLLPGDTFYLFSDGFADQFGITDKKITTRRFKNYLMSIKNSPLTEQENLLTAFLKEWKGETIQTDDILVWGVRI